MALRWMAICCTLGISLSAAVVSGCKQKNDLYCNVETPCADPARPFCDLEGQTVESGGHANTCVALPNGDGNVDLDGAVTDGPMSIDAAIDAMVDAGCSDLLCVGTSPICDRGTGMCRACATMADCTAKSATETQCSSSGACVMCTSNTHCTTATIPVCSSGVCRGCIADGECAGGICDETSGVCIASTAIIQVATNGVDVSGCGSAAAPCATVARGVQGIDSTHAYVLVRPGMYGQEPEQISITGKAVTIVGTGATLEPKSNNLAAILVQDGATVTVEGLTVQGAAGGTNPPAIACEKTTQGVSPIVTLKGVTVRNNAGIGVKSNNCQITVSQSTISSNQGGGVSATGGAVTVSQSTISSNQGGGVSLLGASFQIVNNFLFYNGDINTGTYGGVKIVDSTPSPTPNRFIWNTLFRNSSQTNASGVLCSLLAVTDSFSSNIVWGSQGASAISGCPLTYSIVQGGLTGMGNLDMDPLFVSTSQPDLHLQSTSPARNNGESASIVSSDINSETRPQGAGPDIGADEIP